MKISVIGAVVALLLSGLLAYGCYAMCDTADLQNLITIGAAVQFLCYTLGMFAFRAGDGDGRTTTVVRTFSAVMFVVSIISNFIFACVDFNIPLYIIINGILLILYLYIATGMARE